LLGSTTDFHLLDDKTLFNLHQVEQNSAAIDVLWERYRHLLYGQALSYLKDTEAAKDAVQHAAIQLLTTQKTLEHPKWWLFTIVKNFCLNEIKYIDNKQFIDTENDYISENEIIFVENDHLDTLIKTEAEEALIAALQNLPVEQRVCIELFYWETLSTKQIAEKTGYEVNKVRSYLQNGKLNLRKKLVHTT
jgi:RNA polymerase sigma-70 factor (ECF subfamily)